MKIGISTTLVQRGRSEVGHYLLPLLAALFRHVPEHQYVLFVLEEDLPVFGFARDHARLVVVGRTHRRGAEDLSWHHLRLPALAQAHRLDLLHVPTERRMVWRRSCPLVTTVHHMGPFRRPRAAETRGSCPGAVFRALARRQDGLLVGSQAAATELAQLTGLPAGRVTVAAPGVDVSRLGAVPRDRAAAELIRRHGIHPPFFLVVGCVEDPAQAHLPLIRAFDSFKTVVPSPWQLVFIAGGADCAQRVRLLTRQSPYAADVHCVQEVSADELPLWYRAAGGLIHAPAEWGLASCVTEALGAGCPALVTDVAPARERFGEAALYAPHHDSAALQDRLRELATDVASWSRLHVAAKARALTCDWKSSAEATAEGYLRSAARTRVTRPVPDTWTNVAQPRV